MDNNNEELTKEEKPVDAFSQEGKIGFSNAPAYNKKEAKQRRKDFAKNRPDYKFRKWLRIYTWFAIGAGVLTSMYYFLPLFSGVIGGLLGFIIALVFLIIVLGTIGLIFINEGFRNWVSNGMWEGPGFFFDIAHNIERLSTYFPYIAFPSLALLIGGLVFSIIGKKKYKKMYNGYIALYIIFLLIVIISIIIYYVSGGKTFLIQYDN